MEHLRIFSVDSSMLVSLIAMAATMVSPFMRKRDYIASSFDFLFMEGDQTLLGW